MNRKILGILCALATVAGCDLATKTDWEGPVAGCKPAGPTPTACVENAECCSYACIGGTCEAGTTPGTVCATTNDCGYYYPPTTTGGQMLCKGGHCAWPATCRDVADVCSLDSQCCGGNRCTTGRCMLNRPPVIDIGPLTVANWPVNKTFTFPNTTTDPDGDPMVFTWTLVSKPILPPSSLTFAPSSLRSPSFTPDVAGDYVFDLVVTDQPAPSMQATARITITAVNLPPVIVPALATTTWQRNVGTFAVSMSVYDENLDTITCTWSVCRPGGTPCKTAPAAPAPFTGTLAAPATKTANPVFSTTLLPDDEGDWDVRLTCGDGIVPAPLPFGSTTVTVINTPPVPAVTRPAGYYANLTTGGTAAITLDASVSTDPNGDHLLVPGLSYFWEAVSVSDAGALPTITGFDTATPSFTATRAADYILRVTVTDPPSTSVPRVGAPVPLLVTVKVGRYIRQLAHDVIDSAYAKTANKLVMAGHDPANSAHGMVWVLDAATETEGTGILLYDSVAGVYGVPKFVGVTPDGTKAVVVDDNSLARSIWFVTLGATPTVSRAPSPYATVNDLVVATNRWAYLFSSTWTFTDSAFKEIDLNNDTMANAPWSGYEGFGAASSNGSSNYIYRVETDFGNFTKWPIGNNGSTNTMLASGSATCGGYPGTPAAAIWPILADTKVVSSCGVVYAGSNLVSSGSLGVLPGHMDSTATLAAAASGSTLTLYDATLVQTGTETVPAWGDSYYGRTATISKFWLNSAGTKRFTLVDDTATPVRYGLVVFP